jgi:hypothetical protein
MRDESTGPTPVYERPKLEVLGTFAGLTQGSKGTGIADLHGGHTSGPGS